MSKVSKKITNWLYSVLQPQYTHVEIAYKDIYQFLSVFLARGFRIRTAVFTSAQGNSDLLINLYGSIPCESQDCHINIWVPLNYPFAEHSGKDSKADINGVPLVFIVPHKGQLIRSSNNIDSQGKVYHPFMAQWYKAATSGQLKESFNLLSLMERLIPEFERVCPVSMDPHVTGPALPPKPSKDINPPLFRATEAATNTPSDVGAHNLAGPTPQKYRAPPPLPTQIKPGSWTPVDSIKSAENEASKHSIPLARTSGIGHDWSRESMEVSSHFNSHIPIMQTTPEVIQDQRSLSPRRKPPVTDNKPKITQIEDLMDQVTLESGRAHSDPHVLQRISQNVNEHLALTSPESLNNSMYLVNEMSSISKTLQSQLLRHNQQAKANIENLDSHLQYLGGKAKQASELNKQLYKTADLNKSDALNIYLHSPTERKVQMDDLVLPDSMLVQQLYNTIAEIKGYEDALKLVGGKFASEAELICDSTLDPCIRSIRALSRELFWLEATKIEISKVLGLQL